MNKKIVLSLSAAMLLATSVFASCQNGNMGYKDKSYSCNMMKKGSSFKKHGSIMHMAMMLDLTDEQRVKLREKYAKTKRCFYR